MFNTFNLFPFERENHKYKGPVGLGSAFENAVHMKVICEEKKNCNFTHRSERIHLFFEKKQLVFMSSIHEKQFPPQNYNSINRHLCSGIYIYYKSFHGDFHDILLLNM